MQQPDPPDQADPAVAAGPAAPPRKSRLGCLCIRRAPSSGAPPAGDAPPSAQTMITVGGDSLEATCVCVCSMPGLTGSSARISAV